jgi:hypothetical protein
VNKYNGMDLSLLLLFGLQMGLTILYIIFMDFTDTPAAIGSQIYGHALPLSSPSLPKLTSPLPITVCRWTNNVEYVYVFLIDIFMMVFVGFTMQRAFLRKVRPPLLVIIFSKWY